MKKKSDEENFEEAEAQAYRCWTQTSIPSEVMEVFHDPSVVKGQPSCPPFCHLAAALHLYTQKQPPYTLPLSSTLPDMKSSTTYYIELQKLYKKRAEEEKEIFESYICAPPIKDDFIDLFVKNSHGIRLLRGDQWGQLDGDPHALGRSSFFDCLFFRY
jgi:amyloid beta precursor protein binding protein 1